MDYWPVWSPDGTTMCYISHAPEAPPAYFLFPLGRSLYVRSVRGGDTRTISADDLEISFAIPAVWAPTDAIYAAVQSHATTRVYAFAPDGASRRRVTPEQFHVRSFSLSADGRRMAAIFENVNTAPELYVGDPATGSFEKHTRLGDALKGVAFAPTEVVRWRSGDDRFDVEGFLVKPPQFSPKMRYPLLVNMHGGPRYLYQNAFVDVNFTSGYHTPAQLYAASGYLVLLPNKRGDESFGAEFASAHTEAWGEDVEYDMLAGVDALVARGLADPDKLGVMGTSYGGTAAAWAIAHTTRFKAASIDDAPINLLSYYSQAYLTHDTWIEPFMGGNPSVAMGQFLEKSPILYANRIVTPTLLRYGGERFPRPIAIGPLQGMELFRALHERRVPVDFIYHPTQGHGIADEEIYRDWVRRNLQWFDYWVRGQGSRPLDSTSGQSERQ
jgi:dipeptidyl aminopeptidase/acylaminoacyl peptidase